MRMLKCQEVSSHHAFETYTTWAMMTAEEFGQAEKLRTQYADVDVMSEAIKIASRLFADETSKGMIRLKEHARIERVEVVEIGEFVKDIRTLFL